MGKLVIRSFAVGLVLLGAALATAGTVVRVFHLQHVSVIDASQAVQPLLSEEGSLTLQPKQSRITVQDNAEVVERVAEALRTLDHKPPSYRLQVELLQGLAVNIPATRQAQVDMRLRKMFPFVSYLRLGAVTFEGELGQPATAHLGDSYRVSFSPESLGIGQDTPWGMPRPGARMQLDGLILEQLGSDGDTLEVLRTRVVISEEQQVFIGAGGSEESTTGLVLILNALVVGDS